MQTTEILEPTKVNLPREIKQILSSSDDINRRDNQNNPNVKKLVDFFITIPAGSELDLSRSIHNNGIKFLSSALRYATLPERFTLKLGDNKLEQIHARLLSKALQQATLPKRFYLDMGLNPIEENGRIALLSSIALNLNVETSLFGRCVSISGTNRALLKFAEIDYTSQDKIPENIHEKKANLINKINMVLAHFPNSIFTLLKCLTQKSTTDSFTSSITYHQLADVVQSVISRQLSLGKLGSKFCNKLVEATKDTWLKDTVLTALSLPVAQIEMSKQADEGSCNDATLLVREILKNDAEILKFCVDFAPQSQVYKFLEMVIFGSNEEVKQKNPKQAIADMELMQLVNILVTRSTDENKQELSAEQFSDITNALWQLKDLNQQLLSYVVCEHWKNTGVATIGMYGATNSSKNHESENLTQQPGIITFKTG